MHFARGSTLSSTVKSYVQVLTIVVGIIVNVVVVVNVEAYSGIGDFAYVVLTVDIIGFIFGEILMAGEVLEINVLMDILNSGWLC